MSPRILPSNPQKKDKETLDLLQKMGEAGVNIPEFGKHEKIASSEKVDAEKTASMEKVAVTQEEQTEYWRRYFEEAGVSKDFEDWLDILFG